MEVDLKNRSCNEYKEIIIKINKMFCRVEVEEAGEAVEPAKR